MKFATRCFFSASIVFHSVNAWAAEDSYRLNLSGIGLAKTDKKDTETSSPAIGLQVFFNPVINDRQQAFDQHEFIQRASNLYLTVSPTEVNTSTLNTQLSNTGAALTHYQGDVFAKLAYSKGSGDTKAKDTGLNLGDLESQSSSYAAGYYLFPLSQISLGVDRSRLSSRPSSIAIALGKTDLDDVTTKTGLTSKTLWNIDSQQALCFELSLRSIHHESSSKQQNSESDVSVKFYPVPKAYVQLQWIHNQGEYKDITGNTSMLAAGYAFTPRLSLYAAYLNFTATDSANDSHTTLLAGNYRF